MIECVLDASIFQRKEGFIKLKTALYCNNHEHRYCNHINGCLKFKVSKNYVI